MFFSRSRAVLSAILRVLAAEVKYSSRKIAVKTARDVAWWLPPTRSGGYTGPGGGGVRSKVLYGEALPRVTLFQKPFSTGYPSPLPFVYLLWTNVAPFTYLHPFELL